VASGRDRLEVDSISHLADGSGDPTMKEYIFKLSDHEANKLLMIIADNDDEEALRFLQDTLEKKVKEALRPHCVPVFDQSYHPDQAKRLRKVAGKQKFSDRKSGDV